MYSFVFVSSWTILLVAAEVKKEADENCDSYKVTEENEGQIEADMVVAEPVVVVVKYKHRGNKKKE